MNTQHDADDRGLLEGHGHHLGWAFTSGRLAGQSAALDRQPWPEAAIHARRAAA